jgi:hypothetical protein
MRNETLQSRRKQIKHFPPRRAAENVEKVFALELFVFNDRLL